MEPIQYMTPKKFLQCCGQDKKKCTEITLGAYLGEQFLNLKIYNEGSTFDTYFISQSENATARFFLDPKGRGRRSVSQDKCMDLYDGLNNEVIRSIVDAVSERMHNPVYTHPDFKTILTSMRKNNWAIDQDAEADLITAANRKDPVSVMILLLASIFQDYYSAAGITRRVRSFLNAEEEKEGETERLPRIIPESRSISVSAENTSQYSGGEYREVRAAAFSVREDGRRSIGPVSDLRTNGTYVRRGDLLDLAEKKLDSLEKMGEKCFLLMYGPPGNGKSELARAYAREHAADRFRKEYWLTCPNGNEKFTLESLCRDSFPDEKGKNLLSRLAGADSDVLLIIDNCNSENNSLLNELYYHTGEAVVLLTSRLSSFSGFDERNALYVFSEHQDNFCLEVFRKNYEKKRITGMRAMKQTEKATAAEICRRVYLNPLFISMIACFLREHSSRISINEFAAKLHCGLLEAFPKYSHLDFSKDDSEPLKLQPIEVLQVILREELNCIRLLGEEERQILNLMILFPAEPLSVSLICEILGDNTEQLLMDTVMDRLVEIALLQRVNDEISIHPLVCELILSGVLMDQNIPILYPEKERDAFYSHVLEHIFLFDQKTIRSCMHLAHTIFREIRTPEPVLSLLFSALFSRQSCAALTAKQTDCPEEPALIGYFDTREGRKFILKNMQSEEEKILLDLSNRRRFGRYFGHEPSSSAAASGPADFDSSSEAVLLFFYEGTFHEKEPLILDFSKGLSGHPVREIPDLFMRMCRGKIRLRFPEELEQIGDWAFDSCKGLEGDLELPDSLDRIGKGAFHDCTGLNGELHLPQKLRILDELAFCFCTNLKGPLDLPDSLEELGEMAFGLCLMLKGDVHVPQKLNRVGERAFFQCRELNLSDALLQLIRNRPEEKPDSEQTLYLPPFLDRIEAEAFYGRTGLTGELNLPASLQEIGQMAFYRCGKIEGTLQFSNALKQIDSAAFFGCSGLTGGIDLPESCEKLGEGVFFECSGLDGALRLPGGLTEIPPAAFFMCDSLTEIRNMEKLSELEVIRDGAFFGCESLRGDLYLPEKLQEVGDGAFDGCKNLSGLYFSRTGRIRRLGNGAFFHCSGLTGTLHLPVSIESVGFSCFSKCGYDICFVHSRSCELRDEFIDSHVTLVGFPGSTAEAYAGKHGNPFRILQ